MDIDNIEEKIVELYIKQNLKAKQITQNLKEIDKIVVTPSNVLNLLKKRITY